MYAPQAAWREEELRDMGDSGLVFSLCVRDSVPHPLGPAPDSLMRAGSGLSGTDHRAAGPVGSGGQEETESGKRRERLEGSDSINTC